MSSDASRHSRSRGESPGGQGSRQSGGYDGSQGVTMRPENLSTKPPKGNSASRHSAGSHTGQTGGGHRPRDGSASSRHSGINTAPGPNTRVHRPRDGSTSSRHSDGSAASGPIVGSPKRSPSGSRRPRTEGMSSSRPISSGTGIPSASIGVSMRPGGGVNRPASNTMGSVRSSNNSASLQDVDLNLSHGSDQSVVTLGGVEYPIGSRVGKSGMFIIGDPRGYPRHDLSTVSNRSSFPSTIESHGPIYRGDGKGYNFEYWNWSIIRFVCFIFICLVMVGLLAGVITVGIQHKELCEADFVWWKGSTFYNIPVPFFDDADNSNIGDLSGIERKQSYLEYMGLEAIILENFLWSELNNWNKVVSFTDVDPRLGTNEGMRRLVEILHGDDIRVLLQICPAFTSKKHVWFIESREQSKWTQSQYRDFYIWNDARPEIGWEFDTIRSQYYKYLGDSSKPMLNWANSKLVDAFVGVLEFWLKKGVDGFVICDLEKFDTANETGIPAILSHFHETVASYSQASDSQKILVVDSHYVEHIRMNFEADLPITLDRIDLIKTPLELITENKTAGLTSLIEHHLKYEKQTDGVWILWSPTNLKDIPTLYLGALQLLNLMLPGTPSYTAGQELAKFYLESDERYQAPLLWQAESPEPQNPGGPLPQHNIQALHNISSQRKSTSSLRLDRIPDDPDAGLTYKFLEIDTERDFLLMSRFFPSDNTYYYAVNFGDRDLKKDLAMDITPWATVLADTSNKYHGRLELRDVILGPGQAIVFYPTK